jgi:hypothetical protein
MIGIQIYFLAWPSRGGYRIWGKYQMNLVGNELG